MDRSKNPCANPAIVREIGVRRMTTTTTRPLEGLRVLDLTRALAGPFCTMILADLGADVIKVEPAPAGEMCRSWGPFDRGEGVYFLSVNRNKRSLAIDFRNEDAQALLRRLAGDVDILVENFKPGVMADMGLDYEKLAETNPKLIYASITGFGSDGPYGEWPGFDQIAQGMSGMMSITGFPDGEPTRLGVPLADLTSGMWASTGIIAAVAQRHVTGKGQRVETSLLASLVGMLCVQGQRTLSLGDVPGRIGNDHPVIYPYGAFTAADGPINVAASTNQQWRKLCEVVGDPDLADDPGYGDNTLRSEHRDSLKARLDELLSTRTAMEWTRDLMAAGVPAGPVYTMDQVFADPHVRAAGMVEAVDHPSLGPIELISNPLRLSSVGRETVRTPPPRLGEHGREILAGSGLSEFEIARLIKSGAVLAGDEAS